MSQDKNKQQIDNKAALTTYRDQDDYNQKKLEEYERMVEEIEMDQGIRFDDRKQLRFQFTPSAYKFYDENELATVLHAVITNNHFENCSDNFLTKIAKDRNNFLDEFRSKPDKVSFSDVIVFLFCNAIAGNLEDIIDDSYAFYSIDRVLPKKDDVLSRLYECLLYASEKAHNMVIDGAYLYQTIGHMEAPLNESSKVYKEFIKWKPVNLFNDAKEVDDLFNYSDEPIYLSRSELNQLYLFISPTTHNTEHQKNVRKKAYRTYLKNGFIDNEAQQLRHNHDRELILIGWMAAKGFNKGDKLSEYSHKTLWRELEAISPEHFHSPTGEELGLSLIHI